MFYRLIPFVLSLLLIACQEQAPENTPDVEGLIKEAPPVAEMMEELKANAEDITEEAPASE